MFQSFQVKQDVATVELEDKMMIQRLMEKVEVMQKENEKKTAEVEELKQLVYKRQRGKSLSSKTNSMIRRISSRVNHLHPTNRQGLEKPHTGSLPILR
jgi:predicted RecB family endonuclease